MKRSAILFALLAVLLGVIPASANGPYQLADRVIEPENELTAQIIAAYAPLVGGIPRAHLNLIASLDQSPDGWAFAGYPTFRLYLPLPGDRRAIAHEVGHLVCWRNNLAVTVGFAQRFWPGGVRQSGAVSEYATHDIHEDCAETYRMAVSGDKLTSRRVKWMLDAVPELPR